jgi:hypothetical protein
MSASIPPSAPDEPNPQPSGRAVVPPVPVPDELASVPPGALLGELLEDIDIEQVSGYDTVEVLCAQYRQLCRQQARFYQAVLETGLRKPFSIDTVDRVVRPGEFAAEEARAALVWSRSRAERALSFAIEVFQRLPLLGQAMLAGELDEPRARAFVDWTSGLTGEQAHQVCAQLLPAASGLMVGELIDRIRKACLAIDPDWAEKRRREAVKSRRVVGSRNPDGTANLGGYQQPVDRIAAASERIDTLARACKRAGDSRPIDHVRSDLFIGMTDGTFEGLDEDQIVAYVLAHPYTDLTAPADEGDENDGSGSRGPGGGDEPDEGGSPRGDKPGQGGDPDGKRQPSEGSPLGDANPPGGERVAAFGSAASQPARARVEAPHAHFSTGSPTASQDEPALANVRSWAVPEVRVKLTTLLGIDEHPAEIPPWGYLSSRSARELVPSMYSAEWRYVLCDADGRAVDVGLIRSRPGTTSGRPVRRDARRGGIVELAVPVAEIGRLGAGRAGAGPWARVVAELAKRIGPAERTELDSQNPDTDTRDADRRTAGAALRRWVQQRDRQCVHPCCRAPARKADLDHRIGFAEGGPTVGANLSVPCRHDHRLKDEGHWAMVQPRSGLTVWTSPLGHRYESRPPPVITQLPEPYADKDNRWDCAVAGDSDTACGCEQPILPSVPRRVPAHEPAHELEPTPVFDPDEKPPF